MSSRAPVAIVGGGASGMLAAAALLRTAAEHGLGLEVVLLERSPGGGGVAYSTDDPQHALNVPAGRMSALANVPDDFRLWSEQHLDDGSPDTFAARRDYRRYLADMLERARHTAEPGVAFRQLTGEVTAVEPRGDRVRLGLAAGGELEAQLAILALGHRPPTAPAECERVLEHPAYVEDPWQPGVLGSLRASTGSHALLIGTGLTMVDVALSLAARHPQLGIVAVSRSGLVPMRHLPAGACPDTLGPPPQDASLGALVDRVLADSAAGGTGWYGAVDDLRPLMPRLWRRLNLEERTQFLATRHRAWSVHRHRMAAGTAAQVDRLRASGRLHIIGGSLRLAPAGPLIDASVGTGLRMQAGLVINCTGPGGDPRASSEPLVRSLLASGQARAHPLGLGFATADGGALLSRTGEPQSRLLTLGPPRVGDLYESVAIPEIRVQAQELADAIVARLARAHAA